MGVFAGWQTTLKISGTVTAFTGAATTTLSADGAGRARRQLTTAAQRLLAPTTTLVIKDNGVAVSAANIYNVDPLFGIITFVSGYSFTGSITVDGAYVPLVTIAEGRSYGVSRSRTKTDSTTFESAQASGGGRRSAVGLLTASVDLELLDGDETDLDSGAGTVVLQTLLDQATPKLIEVQYATGYYFRAWVNLLGIEKSSDADALMRQRITAEASAQSLTGNYTFNAYAGVGQ